MPNIQLEVTRDDIYGPKENGFCPVDRAAKRYFGTTDIYTGKKTILLEAQGGKNWGFSGTIRSFLMDSVGREFIDNFDNGREVKPVIIGLEEVFHK